MTKDIIGIDVKVEFADGAFLKGHISPVGTHIDQRQQNPERIRLPLEQMRAAVHTSLKPYKSQETE